MTYVPPSGPVPNDLAIFGEAPGFEEQLAGEGFVGKSGQQLWADMQRIVGLTRDDFYISNIVKDGLPKNRDPKPAEIAAAMPEFFDELERVRPAVVVTAGGFSTRAMLGQVRMDMVHGIPHPTEIAGCEYICLPIYHPAAGLHNKGFLAAFAYDLGRLAAFLENNIDAWAPSGRLAETSWLSEAPAALPKAFKGVVALDTEGWTARPWGLSFSFDGEYGWVIKASETDLLRRFAIWLKGKTIVMHNGIHDLPVLRALGIEVGAYHDTQVLAYHDIMRTGSGVLEAEAQNLGTLACRECQLQLGELTDCAGVDFSEQFIPYTDEVMHYAGMDPIATWRLFKVYEQRGLVNSRPYQIDMGQVPLVELMIATGIPFDTDETLDLYTDVLGKIDAVSTELKAKAARYGNRDFNPGSHPQVRELLTKKLGIRPRKRTRGGLASTSEKALADFKDDPFVGKLQEYRELIKVKGTYVEPLLEALQ